jgi:hypothetical protein
MVSDKDEAALLSTVRPVEGQVTLRSRRDFEIEATRTILSPVNNHIVPWVETC